MTDITGRKPILCLDFDGVCHSYTSGWKGADVIPDAPVEGVFEFLTAALDDFEVNIFSSRSGQQGGIAAMQTWFYEHAIQWYERNGYTGANPANPATVLLGMLRFPTEKPPAFIGIDDRVLTFTGQWPTVEAMKTFQPWNKKQV
jgi:hypothetical protein